MEPFATVADYELRYGAVDDEARLGAMLSDASVFLASQRGLSIDPGDEVQGQLLLTVTCSIVHRSMVSGAYAGLSSVSQGAGGYTASASVYNPSGDFYLTKGERAALGIGAGRIGQTDPYGCGAA